jgi:hypothetical protein
MFSSRIGCQGLSPYRPDCYNACFAALATPETAQGMAPAGYGSKSRALSPDGVSQVTDPATVGPGLLAGALACAKSSESAKVDEETAAAQDTTGIRVEEA